MVLVPGRRVDASVHGFDVCDGERCGSHGSSR
jgi:hypothetical protein